MPEMASDRDLQELQRSRERNLSNPYRATRQGQAATLGHMVGAVSEPAGRAIIGGTAKVHNLLDSVDIGAGRALNSVGVPESWTTSEENINLGQLPHGQPGMYQSKRVYVPRASVPIGRAASIAALASLGLWAKKKFVDSPDENSMETTPMTRTANPNALTNQDAPHTVDTHKLAARVITQQSNLISELQTEHERVAKYAAALAQAVTLAQDGAIDVSDIQNHARQLIASGSVKLSAADDVFDQSPGELQGPVGRPSGDTPRLDPLTSLLRSLPA